MEIGLFLLSRFRVYKLFSILYTVFIELSRCAFMIREADIKAVENLAGSRGTFRKGAQW